MATVAPRSACNSALTAQRSCRKPSHLLSPGAGTFAANKSRQLLNANASLSVRIEAQSSRPRLPCGPQGRRQAAAACAATQSLQGSDVASESSEQGTTYYFLVANAKFMLDDEEHFQELMRERLRFFKEQGRTQDFWLAYEPEFLDRFPEIAARLRRPAVALVTTDRVWSTFMKLRLDRVLKGEFQAASPEEALKSRPVDVHFEKPKEWVAPYPKYEGSWWTPFLPPSSSSSSSSSS